MMKEIIASIIAIIIQEQQEQQKKQKHSKIQQELLLESITNKLANELKKLDAKQDIQLDFLLLIAKLNQLIRIQFGDRCCLAFTKEARRILRESQEQVNASKRKNDENLDL